MNWKLIFQLSAFGLIMAFATVSLIPQNAEPAFWIAIFIFCAYVIAKVCSGKYFLHGLLVSLVNSVWITGVHLYFYTTYMANHPSMAQWMNDRTPIPYHPRWSMVVTGPLFGLGSGLVLGLFAFIASDIVKNKTKSFFLQKKQIGLLCSIIGIILIVISQTIDFTKATINDPYNFNKSVGLPDAFNAHIQLKETFIDTQKKNEYLFIGLGLLIIGGVLFIYDFNNSIRLSTSNKLPDN